MATDCQARCVDGADLGSPPWAERWIANVDPRCPVHGDPAHVETYIRALEAVARAGRHVVDPEAVAHRDDRIGALANALAALDKED